MAVRRAPLTRAWALATVLCASPAAAHQPRAPPGPPPPPGQPAPPGPPPPQPPPADLPSAGGLTAPGAIPDDRRGNGNATAQRLDKSRESDAGRGLAWFWFDVE